jgi:hypothetical protein
MKLGRLNYEQLPKLSIFLNHNIIAILQFKNLNTDDFSMLNVDLTQDYRAKIDTLTF